jgi:hypothetical protein
MREEKEVESRAGSTQTFAQTSKPLSYLLLASAVAGAGAALNKDERRSREGRAGTTDAVPSLLAGALVGKVT